MMLLHFFKSLAMIALTILMNNRAASAGTTSVDILEADANEMALWEWLLAGTRKSLPPSVVSVRQRKDAGITYIGYILDV